MTALSVFLVLLFLIALVMALLTGGRAFVAGRLEGRRSAQRNRGYVNGNKLLFNAYCFDRGFTYGAANPEVNTVQLNKKRFGR